MGYNFDFDFDDKKKTKSLWKKILIEILIWAVCIGGSIYLAYFITNDTLEISNVSDNSMSPTLVENDSILINKLPYLFGDPKRNDIIFFQKKDSASSFYNIKRIIGIPGDTISIVDGKITVNGNEYTENINVEIISNGGLAKNGITLLEDEYFVLGDNRNQSEDSRFATIGIIKRDEIVGKAWLRLNELSIVDELNKLEE